MRQRLHALGAPKTARIYWAGGNPLGGKQAFPPLVQELSNFYNKEVLALPGELEPFARKASLMAALFLRIAMPLCHLMVEIWVMLFRVKERMRVTERRLPPNKRQMLPHFIDNNLTETEFNRIILELHRDSLGQQDLRANKIGKDVTKHPAQACICNTTQTHSHIQVHETYKHYNVE